MSFVNAAPGAMGTTATNLAGIGATISKANAVAAGPTAGLVASAQDQVSAAVAEFFNGHAQGYQALGAQAEAFHQDFVQLLKSGAGAYTSTESDNAAATGAGANTTTEDAATPRGPVGRSAGSSSQVTGAVVERNRSTTGSGVTAGSESRSGLTGLIGVGAASRSGIPVVESDGRAARWVPGTDVGRNRIAGSAFSAPKADDGGLPPAKGAGSTSAGRLAGLIAGKPRGGAAVVTLNARGGGSGGIAHHCRPGVASGGSGGAGGVYRPPPPRTPAPPG